ncbi:MAG: dihydrofolate reductase [Proteobacteria bacterium]|nr:dihydrofolate reductase [Pseudomonadota bacterium]MDA1324188.1 dihydrofolate reductase [Pseudomonadota bacterium]
MRLSLIVAAAENGVIGRDNALPWRLSGDLKRFKEITMGKPLIMGRKTFESIGRPLPGRTNIVLSRDPAFRLAGVEVAGDFSSAKNAALEAAHRAEVTEIMVIGGAGIYQLAFPHADRIYLTEVHAEISGDAVFPAYNKADWIEQSRSYQRASSGETADYSFVTMDRKIQPQR